MDRPIYKVLTAEQWARAERDDRVEAPVDVADGYVHFSTRETLQGTLDKWFVGERDCVLLAYEPADFAATLRWEPSRGGLSFPHVYGPVLRSLARRTWTLAQNESGAPRAPDDLD
ncbi:MAG TPA: DUF952 domain-containing protein [Polyangiaceae bacterium]|nr:DUF952 domain-containing protein [Polyangiaceae bacterium]